MSEICERNNRKEINKDTRTCTKMKMVKCSVYNWFRKRNDITIGDLDRKMGFSIEGKRKGEKLLEKVSQKFPFHFLLRHAFCHSSNLSRKIEMKVVQKQQYKRRDHYIRELEREISKRPSDKDNTFGGLREAWLGFLGLKNKAANIVFKNIWNELS